VTRDGPLAVVRVADEGPGLEAEEAGHVFDRFYRANASRTGEGTGLGLSIVAALATAHGGSARVDTSPGAGSVFVIEIPITDPENTEEPPPQGDTVSETERDAPSVSPGGADDEHLAPSVRR
jgi:two-component system OmpR family sensor kinase